MPDDNLAPIRAAEVPAALASIDEILEQRRRLDADLAAAVEHALREFRLDTYHARVNGDPPSSALARTLYWNYPMIHVAAIADAAGMEEPELRKVAGPGRFDEPCRGGCGVIVTRVVASRSKATEGGSMARYGRDPRTCAECNARIAAEFDARHAEYRAHSDREWEETERELERLRAAGVQPSRRYVEYPGIGGTYLDPDFTPPESTQHA